MLNFTVLKKLNGHRKISPLKQGELFIDQELFNILKSQFQLCHQYTTRPDFLKSMDIMTNKRLGPDHVVQMDTSSFQIRLKSGTKAYFKDEEQVKNFVLSDAKI